LARASLVFLYAVVLQQPPEETKQKMETEEAMKILHKYAGSLNRDVNIKEELLEALDERHK
jgi:hypothetical protein